MSRVSGLSAILAAMLLASQAHAGLVFGRFLYPGNELERINRKLCGRIVDHTFNHGKDNRICSSALSEKRDVYVYLPPNYNPNLQYPLIIYMHGFSQDEHAFFELAPIFEDAVRRGVCPPAIVAAPDGSLRGKPSLLNAGSFFVNSKAGRFEDFVMQDLWNFMHQCYPVRPEREAHTLIGGSMGGFSAFNLGIKYREVVRNVAGILPPLNLRYVDCYGRYFTNFDPDCLGWREKLHPFAPIARYYGVLPVRQRRLVDPLFGRSPNAISRIAAENPVEMLESYDVRPGQLEMFIAYGGRDEFNIDAQVESFVHFAKCRGISPTVSYDPCGRHTVAHGKLHFPGLTVWLGERLKDYSPSAPRVLIEQR